MTWWLDFYPETDMSDLLETVRLTCPYCGESFETSVDCSAGSQAYIEDCEICCRPIELQIECNDQAGLDSIQVSRDDD